MIKKACYSIILLLWCCGGFAQQKAIDSLSALLPFAQTDTAEARLLIALADAYTSIDRTQSIAILHEANHVLVTDDLPLRATILHNLFMQLYWNRQYNDARKYALKALPLFELLRDYREKARCQNMIGLSYFKQFNYAKALPYLLEALTTAEMANDSKSIGNAYTNIGMLHVALKDTMAISDYQQAYSAYQQAGDTASMALALNNMANYHSEHTNAYGQALAYHQQALYLKRTFAHQQSLCTSLLNIGNCLNQLNSADSALLYLQEAQQLLDSLALPYHQSLLHYYTATAYALKGNQPLALKNYRQAVAIAGTHELDDVLLECYKELSALYQEAGDYKNGLLYQKMVDKTKEKLALYQQIEATKKLELQYQFKREQAADSIQYEAAILRKALELEKKQAVIDRDKIEKIGLWLGVGVLLTIALLVYRYSRVLAFEKQRSENLLLNILPEATAEELKQHGSAKAQHYKMVSVLFTDFKGFTQLSEQLTTEALIAEIDYCYQAFDSIVEAHGVEKIKTIGDAYMAVGGVPTANTTNSIDTVRAALAICNFMQEYASQRRGEGLPFFEIRIGVHTGEVIAGVVGHKKFAYDVWGDTVNTAARMESSGEVGRVNVSEATYRLVQQQFKCVARGAVAAKNKGELKMWFVEGESEGGV